MTVPDNAISLGVEVPVDKIELELRQLWEVDEARTNASLINLAVYSEAKGALADNSDIIREITREHACRALLIGLDKQIEEISVRAWIKAHCHLAHGKKSVCCEQIAFHLTGHSTGRFRNTIFAHLQSDLPLIFWWQGNLSDMFSESLYRRIDRLVIDSSDWNDPVEQFAKINEAISLVNLVVQDLAWTRTYHFRLAIASLYDDLVASKSLKNVSTIKIIVNPKYFVSGLQLLAWFAEMSGWKRTQDLISDEEEAGSYRFLTKEGNIVDAEITLEKESAPIGKIEIISDGITICVSRESGNKHLHHQLKCGLHEIDLHGPADSDSSVELVADQLSRGGKNSLFKKVLPIFYELLEK
ncbi:MAG: glucose-6-phosphate dehydrogenase assembly protein OpcA [Cryomorphaceae bacterium]|jgi:glucose-6-phosphate dehydrogenase assembly protein OpcA